MNVTPSMHMTQAYIIPYMTYVLHVTIVCAAIIYYSRSTDCCTECSMKKRKYTSTYKYDTIDSANIYYYTHHRRKEKKNTR